MRIVESLTTQLQVETSKIHQELEEQLRTQSSNNKAIGRKMDKEIAALYTQIGEMATTFVAQREEHNNRLNGIYK